MSVPAFALTKMRGQLVWPLGGTGTSPSVSANVLTGNYFFIKFYFKSTFLSSFIVEAENSLF